jgi:hypothetical protein
MAYNRALEFLEFNGNTDVDLFFEHHTDVDQSAFHVCRLQRPAVRSSVDSGVALTATLFNDY